jgi:hypothetical protein
MAQKKISRKKATTPRSTRVASAPADVAVAGTCVVHGTVSYPDTSPATGLSISAFDQDIGGEDRLGAAVSDGKGRYRIEYGDAQFRRSKNERQGAYPMVMVLPFVLGLVAALLAVGGRRNAALGLGVVTVIIQVWWLAYHATDTLAVSL